MQQRNFSNKVCRLIRIQLLAVGLMVAASPIALGDDYADCVRACTVQRQADYDALNAATALAYTLCYNTYTATWTGCTNTANAALTACTTSANACRNTTLGGLTVALIACIPLAAFGGVPGAGCAVAAVAAADAALLTCLAVRSACRANARTALGACQANANAILASCYANADAVHAAAVATADTRYNACVAACENP